VGSIASQHSGSRDNDFRANLKLCCGFQSSYIPCMLTTRVGNSNQVCVAHILPCRTKKRIAEQLNLSLENLNDTRNGLFLAKNIEVAFDKLQLSFIPQDILHPNSLKMVMWDQDVSSTPIWEAHADVIGQYEGCTLQLGGHSPYRRALSYQAYIAHASSKLCLDDNSRPQEFGIPGSTFYYSRQISQEEVEANLKNAYREEVTLMIDDEDEDDNEA